MVARGVSIQVTKYLPLLLIKEVLFARHFYQVVRIKYLIQLVTLICELSAEISTVIYLYEN